MHWMDLENCIPTFILFVDKWSILTSLISMDGLFLTLLYLCKLIQAEITNLYNNYVLSIKWEHIEHNWI